MNKEELILHCRHYAKVTKDFSVREYHRLADFTVKQFHRLSDFLAKKKLERRNNGSNVILGMSCTKYIVVLMSIFYLLIALLMIAVGTSSYLALESFYDLLWFDFHVLIIIWIFSGVMLIVFSLFGIIGAFKESVIWTNIYGVLLLITFVLQILTSIAAFCLIATGSSRYHAFNMVNRLMQHYYENHSSAQKMDWIQTTFECCGGEYPSDWDTMEKIRLDYNYRYEIDPDTLSYVTTQLTTEEPIKYKTPASCCTKESAYQNMTCENYYQKGCNMFVREFVAETILIIGTTLLAIGVMEFLGMVIAFSLARMFRRATSYRNIQKWKSQYNQVVDTTTDVKYAQLHNSTDAVDDVNSI